MCWNRWSSLLRMMCRWSLIFKECYSPFSLSSFKKSSCLGDIISNFIGCISALCIGIILSLKHSWVSPLILFWVVSGDSLHFNPNITLFIYSLNPPTNIKLFSASVGNGFGIIIRCSCSYSQDLSLVIKTGSIANSSWFPNLLYTDEISFNPKRFSK